MGAHLEALDEGVLTAPLDPKCTSVEFDFVSVQVCRLEFFITKARVEMVFQASIMDTQQGLCVCLMKYGALRASSAAEAVGLDHR